MVASHTFQQCSDAPAEGTRFSLLRLAGTWLLGLMTLYSVYAWGAFLTLDVDLAAPVRIAMAVGPAMVACALLVSPSLFAAGVRCADLLDIAFNLTRRDFWMQMGVCAAVAFLLSALGAGIVPNLVLSVQDHAQEMVSGSAPELAALILPFELSGLAALSGIAGALVGHATGHWKPLRRNVARWFACLALMASFLIPLLVAVNALVQHGASPVWVLAVPLAIPLTLTTILARRERHSFAVSFPWGRTGRGQLDGEAFDRIVTGLVEGPESEVDGLARSESEIEMAHLAAAIRRIAAPRATMSESRAAEIVAGIATASPSAPGPARRRWPRPRPGSVGGFCTSWTCIAAGLVIVSPLGGVPISVVSAVATGLLGSAGIVMLGRRRPGVAAPAAT